MSLISTMLNALSLGGWSSGGPSSVQEAGKLGDVILDKPTIKG